MKCQIVIYILSGTSEQSIIYYTLPQALLLLKTLTCLPLDQDGPDESSTSHDPCREDPEPFKSLCNPEQNAVKANTHLEFHDMRQGQYQLTDIKQNTQ